VVWRGPAPCEPGLVELEVGLEANPEFRACSEGVRQFEGSGAGDPFPASDDLVDGLKWPVHQPCETGLREPSCLQLLGEDLDAYVYLFIPRVSTDPATMGE